MTRTRSVRFSPRARGQALVLACVALFLAALVVVTSAQLGQGVSARIQLQDAADASAHALALEEARAFNLYAYANRTQVSHYVAAMIWQSNLSFLYFNEAFLTDLYGAGKSLFACAEPSSPLGAACRLLLATPGVGQVFAGFQGLFSLLGAVVATYQAALERSGLDARVGRELIPAHRTLNAALASASTAMMRATLSRARSMAEDLVRVNAPGAESAAPGPSLEGLNACLFDRGHVREANGSPLAPNESPHLPLDPRARVEAQRTARVKRAMGAIANATRIACDTAASKAPCAPGFVTARTLERFAPALERLVGRGGLVAVRKFGQTRMLTHELGIGTDPAKAPPPNGNYLREWTDPKDAPAGTMAQGDELGADDLYQLRIGPPRILGAPNPWSCDEDAPRERCWGEPRLRLEADRPFSQALKPSIWAKGDARVPQGIHWRVVFPSYPASASGAEPERPNAPELQDRLLGLNRFDVQGPLGLEFPVYVANVRPVVDGNHPWQGLAPFSHFEPSQFERACGGKADREGAVNPERAAGRGDAFNQPSSWVALRYPDAGSPSPTLGMPWGQGGRIYLDGRNARGPFAWAIARGQTYYHRPGNWEEPPNFFNPYWRARLAPIHEGELPAPVRTALDGLPERLRKKLPLLLLH